MAQKLSSIVTTTRDIRNTETGIDIYVYEERKNFASKRTIKATIYNIIIVSNLPVLNAKEGETVQYALDKSHEECEKFHKNVSIKFPGTLIPDMPNKPIRMLDTADKAKIRKSQLGTFLKFCAKTPKISTSEIMLKFLGVETVKIAGKDPKDSTESERSPEKDFSIENKHKVDLFKPSIDTSGEIFSSKTDQQDDDSDHSEEIPPFEKRITSNTKGVRLFDGDDSDITMFQNVNAGTSEIEGDEEEEEEDNNLFESEKSDDDLDEILRRLEDSKIKRKSREEDIKVKISAAKDAVIETSGKAETNEFAVSDISKYISENTVNLNDVDLGL